MISTDNYEAYLLNLCFVIYWVTGLNILLLQVVVFFLLVCFDFALLKEIMFRLCLFSSCVSRLHIRGVSVISEHTRAAHRGNLTTVNVAKCH